MSVLTTSKGNMRVMTWVEVQLRVRVRFRHLVVLVKLMVRGSGIHYVNDFPHKDIKTNLYVHVSV